MGHTPGSTVMERHYLPKTSRVDVAGMAAAGEKDTEAVSRLGNGATAIKPLTPPQLQSIGQDPRSLQARKERDLALATSPQDATRITSRFGNFHEHLRRSRQLEDAKRASGRVYQQVLDLVCFDEDKSTPSAHLCQNGMNA